MGHWSSCRHHHASEVLQNGGRHAKRTSKLPSPTWSPFSHRSLSRSQPRPKMATWVHQVKQVPVRPGRWLLPECPNLTSILRRFQMGLSATSRSSIQKQLTSEDLWPNSRLCWRPYSHNCSLDKSVEPSRP